MSAVSHFDRRGGAAQHRYRAAQFPVDFRRPDCGVKRRVGLVVRTVVALIDHNQADIWQGREQGRARPDDQFEQSGPGAPPGVVTLAVRQARVDESHLAGKTVEETAHGLGREGNLRDKDNHPPSAPYRLGGGPQVEFGLAGAGDAVQEEWLVG